MARAKSSPSSATIGFEAKLWLLADKLRNNMDAAVTERSDKRRQQPEPYKHVVLGLIFLKYISDNWRAFRGAKGHRGDISIYGQESNATPRRDLIAGCAH